MKIAILMLIHEYSEQQKKLIEYLSKDFDIYIHVDKKTPINIHDISIINNNVYVFKKYKIYWGNYTQILATLFLFSTAFYQNKYNRYIFISGSCLPIKSNNYIHNFFSNTNKEFLEYFKLPKKSWDGNGGFDRIDYYYPKSNSRVKINFISKLLLKIINKINNHFIIPFMKILKIKRNHKKLIFYGGANWMDLTNNCVSQIINFTEKNKWYIRRFKYTRCADEIFFQTIIFNFVKNIEIDNKLLRYIDWNTGPDYPRILCEEDFIKIKESDCLFARKFDSKKDANIIQMIFNQLL